MNTLTFDTLKYANKLKAAGVAPPVAEAEAELLSEVLEINLKDLATKQDLEQLRAATKQDIEQLRAATKQDLRETELKLEAKIAETKAELIRWVVGVGFLQTTLIVALAVKIAHWG